MALNSNDVGLMAFQKFVDVLRTGSTKSLAEYTKNFRAEPLVMLDSSLVFEDATYDVMQSLQSQYAAYYLLAMSTMTTIGNIQVSQHMNKLNPSRSVVDAAAGSAAAAGGFLIAQEAFNLGLPSVSKMKAVLESDKSITGAADLMGRGDPKKRDHVDTLTVGAGRNTVNEIKELSNLSVGKVITCDVSDGNKTVSIPVAIRLICSSLPSDNLIHILNGGTMEKGWTDRWHGWRSGRLSLADMFFCNDLVDAERKRLMDDDSGMLRAMKDRKSNNKLAAILSGQPSVGTYSNMAVISAETAKELELSLSGRSIKDFRTREKLFDNSTLMILAIVDSAWKRVTFYHQSIDRPIEASFRDLKSSNKGSGPDIAEILNAYRMGTTPVL